MQKIRIAVVGYGNVGRKAVEAVQASPDMELAGVVRRNPGDGGGPPELAGIPIVKDIAELGKVDVAVLCAPTRAVPRVAESILSRGISTVDSYDIHGESIWSLRTRLDAVAKVHGAVAIVAAGWDPGTDSVIRAMFEAMAPRGLTFTNFGPGMSMGHTVAVKSIPGVRDALSLTIPAGMGVHRRAVYVELEEGADFAQVEKAIVTDPYFAKDETKVTRVDSVRSLIDMGHGVSLERKGASGLTDNQLMRLEMRINNPALTAQIMAAAARATTKMPSGAYTLLEVPVIHLLPGETGELIKRLV